MKKLLTCCIALLLLTIPGCKKDDKSDSKDKEKATEEKTSSEKSDDDSKEADKEKSAKADKDESAQDAGGQWVESELYGLKFRIPEDWKVTQDDEGVSATDPEGTTTVLLAGSESDQLVNSTLNELRSDVSFKEVKLEKSGLTTINGIPGMKGTGTAVMEGEDMDEEIQYLAYSLKLDDKTATMMIFSEATMYEAKKELIKGIAQTIVKTQ